MGKLDEQFSPASHSYAGNVPCGNPLDPRPAANAIVEAVNSAKKHAGQKPIVVLIGESHAFASHKALAQIAIGQLARIHGAQLQVFYEIAKNHLEFSIDEFLGIEIPNSLRHQLQGLDRENLSLLHYLAYFSTISAPEANANLMRFCIQNKIRSNFNDAMSKSIEGMSFLDPDDPDLDWKEHPIPSGNDINDHVRFSSPLGVYMRNKVMVKRALEGGQMEPGRVIVQLCGQNHVLGITTDTEDKPYSSSLCALYRDAGAIVIPVLPTFSLTPGMLPADAPLENAVFVEGLAGDEFFTEATAEELGVAFTPEAENAFMRQIESASDGAYQVVAADPMVCEKVRIASIRLLEIAMREIDVQQERVPSHG